MIVHDPRGAEKRMLHLADGPGKEALKGFLSALSAEDRGRAKVVAVDMHEPTSRPSPRDQCPVATEAPSRRGPAS